MRQVGSFWHFGLKICCRHLHSYVRLTITNKFDVCIAYCCCKLLLRCHIWCQARSQKFAMGGGCFGGLGAEPPAAGGQWGYGKEAPSRRRLGVWGKVLSRRRHGGLGAEPPALENFAFFCKNNFISRLF